MKDLLFQALNLLFLFLNRKKYEEKRYHKKVLKDQEAILNRWRNVNSESTPERLHRKANNRTPK